MYNGHFRVYDIRGIIDHLILTNMVTSPWMFFYNLIKSKLSEVFWNSVFKRKMDNSIQKPHTKTTMATTKN